MTYTINLKKTAVVAAAALLSALAVAGLSASRASALSCNDCVTTNDIVNEAVTGAKIAVGTITGTNIKSGSIQTSDLAQRSVTNLKIGLGAVDDTNVANGSLLGDDLNPATNIGLADTRATGDAGSFQTLAGDLTYEGAAGGTSSYHAGVMGNFLGDTLTNTTSAYHAGVIGSYNVTTSDANTGAQAGVVAEVGDGAVASGTNAFTAVLGGDSGALTPDAAYGVQYFNSTAGSHFNYGLDLYHAATTDYGGPSAVDYGTADIRLASGATISSGSATPGTCVTGSLFLDTDGGADATLRACTATNTWTAVSNE